MIDKLADIFIAVTLGSVTILMVAAMALVIIALLAQGVYLTTGTCWNFILVCAAR